MQTMQVQYDNIEQTWTCTNKKYENYKIMHKLYHYDSNVRHAKFINNLWYYRS